GALASAAPSQIFASTAGIYPAVEAVDATIVPVKGKVVNERGETLPGVNIVVKGTSKGTITDADGNFSIQLPTDGQLVFSYIGYYSTERNADTDSNLTIVMREDAQTLGEVVVTTQKRRQTSIEVPVSVSALSGNNLQRLGLQQMDEMSQFIPGLQVQIQSPNNPGYVIRGVTSDEGDSYSQPRISAFMDGVSISRSRASVVELFDMERVEVVKGPQGTLFGRGAEIGAMHLIRNKPTNYLSGEISVNYGTHNQRGASGYINTPILKDKLANRFAFSYDAHDGYIKNLAGGRLNGKNAIALRNSTRLFAGENTVMDLVLDYQYDNAPGTSFKSQKIAPRGGDTSPFTAAELDADDLGIKRHVGGAAFTVDHTLNDAWKMTSITGFRAFKADENFDGDGTYLPLLDVENNTKGTQLSQEFRFNYDKGGRFSGFVGASYFYEHSSVENVIHSNMQYLFPAYIGSSFNSTYKPTFQSMLSGISTLTESLKQMYPAYAEQINLLAPILNNTFSSLLTKWFPDEYDATTPMTTTPDFYGDLNAAYTALLTQYPMIGALLGTSIDSILAAMDSTGATATMLKSYSALPLSEDQEENATDYGTNQAAEIFADGTLHIVKGLSLTVGLRGTYEHQKTGYYSTTQPNTLTGSTALMYNTSNGKRVYMSDDYYSWVGRVALNYMFQRNNAYISVSRGRRPGVLYFQNSPDEPVHLKPEIIVSYEAGIKGSVLKDRLNYDFSVYYYDWSHFQTSRLDTESSSMANTYISDDAGKAHSFGVELGLRYALTKNVNVFGNYAYIDGKFNDTDENGNAQYYAGNRFRLTPKHSFALGLDVNIPVNTTTQIYLRPSYSYKSDVFFEDSNDPALKQEGYGLANFNAGIRLQPKRVYYEISAFGKNVLNEKYLIDAGNSGNQIGFPTFVAGSPSVFGVAVKVGF
ncbi:MAG: TonB-dependent receptor, partial [Bacteroides sp.]|nr:TonB-dependent receptor [Bacteroides sp.]